MSQLFAALDGAWRVLLAGLLLGSLLPAVFSLGIRQLALAQVPAGTGSNAGVSPRRIFAYVLFAFVISCVLLGLTYIIMHGFGYQLSFSGLAPVVSKK